MKQSNYDFHSKEIYRKSKTYAVKHRDETERLASQSGGMFAALSDAVLKKNGVVYGCAFDENYKAVHIRADNKDKRDRMRYSKYVQSDLGNTYRDVLSDLKAGKTVLFSGTTCQVAGINSFLDQYTPQIQGVLYTVDIVCHGVPSPKIWRDYLQWEKRRANADLSDVVCRNKKTYGWQSHVTTLKFINGKTRNSRLFPGIFYSHVILRPCCFRCPYKDTHHPSDITIADYWGIEKDCPGFKDKKGVSLVLVNNSHGEALFNECDSAILFHETELKGGLQKPLVAPYNAPSDRAQFWEDYRSTGFDEIAKKYSSNTLKKRARRYIRKVIYTFFGPE